MYGYSKVYQVLFLNQTHYMQKAFIDTVIMTLLAALNVAASIFMYGHTDLSANWSVFVCSIVLMSLASVLVNFKQSSNIHYTEVNIHGAKKVETIEKTDKPENVRVKVEQTCRTPNQTAGDKKRSEVAKK